MSIKKTLGGDRLGSGNRMKQEMHNFFRSNHNLSSARATSMAPGILYPFYIRPCSNGDSFDIDLNAFVRTIPTKGPLFGSFKLQVDFFQCPVRLYQGILHNNPINIGLKMSQVKLPKINYTTKWDPARISDPNTKYQELNRQAYPSSLARYLGLAGVGRSGMHQQANSISRKFNAVPILAYYDIFKNYYANKQEENAYVISPLEINTATQATIEYAKIEYDSFTFNATQNSNYYMVQVIKTDYNNEFLTVQIYGKNITEDNLYLSYQGNYYTLTEAENQGGIIDGYTITDYGVYINMITNITPPNTGTVSFSFRIPIEKNYVDKTINLISFPLSNIDKMREILLSKTELGTEYVINDAQMFPYATMCEIDNDGYNLNRYPHNGLCVKTYQSDMFNNWIDTEWIDGENGINAITAVSTEAGSFTIDSLNLANKVYNMLNRIAISGGTYQDWQEAVYTQNVIKHCETPMYLGGMSSEVVFDEVISSAASGDQVLGTIGGRGALQGRKGGRITTKIKEPSFIMGIVSLTPRVMYSQGNEFFLTEFDSVDDFHKPSLDGIGFQDLLVERFNFLGTVCAPGGSGTIFRESAGKQTAWIDYQTDVDRCYGDFALLDGAAYMVLNRNYTVTNDGKPSDITTYIDPTKFNYAFAVTDLTAQNFWTFINVKNRARLLMSAKQIPNL